jgi:flagellar basal body-associated protein FliL
MYNFIQHSTFVSWECCEHVPLIMILRSEHGRLNGIIIIVIIIIIIYLFKLQMGFYMVAVYYNKTQYTNKTPHSNKHSTQNYTSNKGHTTHNMCG